MNEINIDTIKNFIEQLKENNVVINAKITTKCEYGHKYTTNMDNFNDCPLCLKYTPEHINSMIMTRRHKQSIKIDINQNDKSSPACVYIAKLEKQLTNESFYKIGYSIKSVYDRLIDNPYEIVKYKSIFTNLAYAKLLERHLHILHDEYSYQPLIGFDGCSECFTKILPETYPIFNNINIDNSKTIADIIMKYI